MNENIKIMKKKKMEENIQEGVNVENVNEIDQMLDDYRKLEEEKAELNDRYMRLYSEFENYKKRTQKERLELFETASERVILELLPIVDDFERAVQANAEMKDVSVLKDGFELIYNKLQGFLKKNQVEVIPALGEEFNTDLHEAITHFPAQKEEDKNKVVEVVQNGYKLKGKVIRFAKVVVAG
jgi:molecular chaperone GrpE